MIVALLVGALVGLVVGVLGAGGCILAVPALTLLLGQPPHGAAAGSLLIVLATSLVALPHRFNRHEARVKEGVIFGLLSAVGSVVGARLSAFVPGWLLFTLFGLMVGVVGVQMLVKTRASSAGAEQASSNPQGTPAESSPDQQLNSASTDVTGVQIPGGTWKRNGGKLFFAALITGLLTGFFGVGGGFLIVPVLTLLMHYPIREASGTSLIVMSLASVFGLIARIGQPLNVDWSVVVFFMVGSMVGGVVGGPLSTRIRPVMLQRIFGFLLLIVCAVSLASVVV